MDILDFFWTFYLNHLSPLQGYFYLLCCFSTKFFSISIDIKFDIWLNIIYSRCFIDIFW